MFEVAMKVTDQQIADTLCSAFEGGSNYWIVKIEGKHKPTVAPPEGEDLWLFWWPVLDGSVVIEEYDPDTGSGHWALNRQLIEKGLQLMAEAQPFRINQMVNEEGDAETGDVFLQYCLFGEILYS